MLVATFLQFLHITANVKLSLQAIARGDIDVLAFIKTISQRKFTVQEAKQAKEAFMVGSSTLVRLYSALVHHMPTSLTSSMMSVKQLSRTLLPLEAKRGSLDVCSPIKCLRGKVLASYPAAIDQVCPGACR